METRSSQRPDSVSVVRVRRAERLFAIPLSALSEVGRLPPLDRHGSERLPLIGSFVLRGESASVVDVIGGPAETFPRCFLALRGPTRVCIGADELLGVEVISLSARSELSEGPFAWSVPRAEALLYVIDPQEILRRYFPRGG
jgi:hypothetical protein